jgi:hypothetical protein
MVVVPELPVRRASSSAVMTDGKPGFRLMRDLMARVYGLDESMMFVTILQSASSSDLTFSPAKVYGFFC